MKIAIVILALVTASAMAMAEGPAAGPSSQTGCALVPTKDLKPDSGKNVANLPKSEQQASQNAAPAPDQTLSGCKQKEVKASGKG